MRIPSSTYRLQLHSDFTLANAAEIVEYLHELGISDCYLSPLAQARAGSRHCYDVINHSRLNPEIGGEEGFRDFAVKVRKLGMGIVVDTVPNHMCIADPGNAWWFDVLENGPSSPFASFFDIDWHPPKHDLADKVLLPVLGDQFGRVLENKEIAAAYRNGAFSATYHNMVFPLAPRTWTVILEPAYAKVEREQGESSREALELASIMTALNHLPLRTETDAAPVRERQREKEVIKSRLAALMESSPATHWAVEASIRDLNGVRGVPHSFDRMEKVLDDQAYRLSFWGVAADEINYRRFFDVNDLAAIRAERPDVFAATHELVLGLIREGLVTGLRIDHVDGLRDPGQYLHVLQNECARAMSEAREQGISRDGLETGADEPPASSFPFYLVVEKILAADEPLRADWPIHGTTGYDFLNDLNGLFVERAARAHFADFYARLRGHQHDFADEVYDSKKLVLRASMSGEQNVLARRLDRISEQHRWSRDFTLNSLGRALAEMIACFPVYRSYVTSTGSVSTEDRRYIVTAADTAKRRNPALSESTFDFVTSVLLLAHPEGLDESAREERLAFTLQFQQITGPAMAKGFEDTALYRNYPLASLNDVGGDPTAFGVSVDAFHARNQRRLREWPHALSTTSTHDTKRGEDVRARINVLSEILEAWEAAVRRWRQMNERARVKLDEGSVPDGNEEYLFYQTLVGAWPFMGIGPAEHRQLVRRVQDYMHKAAKEAKLHTSWVSPNQPHEQALAEFVRLVLQPRPANAFFADFVNFLRPVAMAGMLNSLSQMLLKICSPGIPDFFQGTELWDDNLVDPDNRRPVDFTARRAMLDEIGRRAADNPLKLVEELLANPRHGQIKMYVMRCALNFRREHPELFAAGAYMPLEAVGAREQHAVAFARCHGRQHLIVAAGRFFMRLGDSSNSIPDGSAWRDTTLALSPGPALDCPSRRYVDLFTGESVSAHLDGSRLRLPLDEVFARMPVAMLTPAS